MKLFYIIADSKHPQSPAELAKATGANESLIHRILRYLAGHDVVKEYPDVTYGPSELTKLLTIEGYDKGLSY